MWKAIYDYLLTFFTDSWASFLVKNPTQGRLIKNIFDNSLYGTSGFILLFFCGVACLLYYFYFNKKFGRYYSGKSWAKCMFLTATLVFIATLINGYFKLHTFITPTLLLYGVLSLINFVYSIFVFTIFSVICQLVAIAVRRLTPYDISPMASRTPF
jgi:hypothetical protein